MKLLLPKEHRRTRQHRWFPWAYSRDFGYTDISFLGVLAVAFLIAAGVTLTLLGVISAVTTPGPEYECAYNEALIRAENGYRCVDARVPDVKETP